MLRVVGCYIVGWRDVILTGEWKVVRLRAAE